VRVVRTALALLALIALAACASKPDPIRPLRTPTALADITGIWRSPGQSTLELRANGSYVLITSVSNALAGEFTLSQDRITFFDDKECGGAQGTYRIQVAVEQRMEFSEPDDGCALRRDQLTADPYVYG
jgi:hypothetical protein